MARRLTKAEQEQLRRASVWDSFVSWNAAKPEHAGMDISDEEFEAMSNERVVPDFSNVVSGTNSTYTERNAPEVRGRGINTVTTPFGEMVLDRNQEIEGDDVGAAVVADPFIRAAATAGNIVGNALDWLSPDPHPLTERNADDGVVRQVASSIEDAGRNIVDTYLSSGLATGRVPFTGVELWGDSAENQRWLAARNAQGNTEELVAARNASPLNRAGDAINQMSGLIRDQGTTQLSRDASQRLGDAAEESPWALARAAASPEGALGLLNMAGESAPYAALGFGAGAAARTAAMSPLMAQTGAGAVVGLSAVQQNARQQEESINNMADEELLALPMAQTIMASGVTDVDAIRRQVARTSHMATVANSELTMALSMLPGNLFERMGAGNTVRQATTDTLARIAARKAAPEIALEAAQGGSEGFAQNIAEIGTGQRERGDLYQGVAGQAALEALAAGPVTVPGAIADARTEGAFESRADRLSAAADRLEALAAQRQVDQAEDTRAARQAEADFLRGYGPSVSQESTGRPVEPYADWAQREADTAPVRQPDTVNDAEDFNRMPVGATPSRGVRFGEAVQPSAAALRADAERTAATLANENLEQDAFEAEQAGVAQTRQEARQGAASLDASTRASDIKAAKSKHSAARRAHLTQVQRQNASLPEAERVETIANAALAWDKANPAPTEQAQAAPVAAPRGRATPAPVQRTAEEEAARVATLRTAGMTQAEIDATSDPAAAPEGESEADFRKRLTGRASLGTAARTDQSAADVVRKLAERVRGGNDKEALQAERLLVNGKLSVVDGDVMADVAGDENSSGYYDGERMYINAAYMPEDTTAGAVLYEILAHEADHAARLSGNADAKSSVGTLLGDGAKERLIEQVETSAHPIAQQTRDALAARGITRDADPALYEDEATAYAIQAAIASREGGVWAPVRGLVSAARRKYKEFTGDDSINLDDLAAYASQTVDVLANSQSSIASDTDGRAMVVGPQATTWDQITNRYLGSVDGMERGEISDALAEITTDERDLRDLIDGETFMLDELLNHEPLFEAYPQLRSRKVHAVKMKGSADGAFDGRNLLLSDKLVAQAMVDTLTADYLRRVVLHEVQHAVQEIEGFERGGNPNEFIPKDILEEYNMASARFDSAVENFPLERALNTIPPDARAEWQDRLNDWARFNELDPTDPKWRQTVARKFLNEEYAGLSNNSIITNAQRSYNERKERLGPARGAYENARNRAYDQYRKLYGEAEARNTEVRSRWDDATLANYPPEQTMGMDDSAIGVEQTTSGRRRRASTNLPPTPDTNVVPYRRTRTKKASDAIKEVFTVYGAVGKEGGRLVEEEGHARDAIYAIALSYRNRSVGGVRDAAQRVAAAKGISQSAAEKEVNEMLTKRLRAIAEVPSASQRDKLIARMVQENPELRPVQEAIMAINAMTDNIIGARMADPTPLTDDERQLYEYMHKNKSAYFTNVYALFQGQAGKEYAQRMAEGATDAYEAIAEGKAIPKSVKEEYRVYDRALKFVIANDIAVSDPEMLSQMSTEDLSSLYDMWAPNNDSADNLRRRMSEGGRFDLETYRADMEEKIAAAVENAGEAEILRRGHQTVKGLLGLHTLTGPARRYARGMGVDDSILRHRKELPSEISELYGQINDMPSLILTTLTKQGELSARMNFLQRLSEESYGSLVVSKQDSALPEYQNFTIELKGDNYGPVKGMMTTPEMAQLMTNYSHGFTDITQTLEDVGFKPDLMAQMAAGTAGNIITKQAGLQKAATILWRPDYMLMNLAGSVISPVLVGGVKPQHLQRAMKVAGQAIMHTLDPTGAMHDAQVSNDLYLALQIGVMDNVVTQELRTQPRKLVRDFAKGMADISTVSQMRDYLHKAKDVGHGQAWKAWVETYSMSDAWVKFAVALERADFLQSFYEANGETKTNNEIMLEAADYTKNQTLTLSRVPRIIQVGERLGATRFMPYIASVFRVLGRAPHEIAQTIKRGAEAKTPEAARIAYTMAARQAAGLAATAGLSVAGLRAIAQALIDDDDEQKAQMERDREFMYDEAKYGELIYMGQNEKGENQYFLLSRIDQFGPAFDLARTLTSDRPWAEKADAVKDSFMDTVIWSASLPVALKAAMDITTNTKMSDKDTRIERIFPAATDAVKTFIDSIPGFDYSDANSLVELADLFVPAGPANIADPANLTPLAAEDGGATLAAALLASGGHKLVTVSPEVAMGIKASELRDLRTDATNSIRDTLNTRGPDAALAVFVDKARTERELVRQLGTMYHAALDSGMRRSEAEDALGNLDATSIANLRRRTYETEANDWNTRRSSILTSSSMENMPRDRTLTKDEQKQAERDWKATVREVRRRMQTMGYDSKENN